MYVDYFGGKNLVWYTAEGTVLLLALWASGSVCALGPDLVSVSLRLCLSHCLQVLED